MNKIKLILGFLLISFLCLTNQINAAPTIMSTSGSFAHGGTVMIQGSSFGTKSPAAPLVWDDGSGTNLLDKWTHADPHLATDPKFNIQYRSSYRNVSSPHTNVSKFITGGHAQSGYTTWNASGGPNVALYKATGGTENWYVSFYYRLDPLWPPNNGEAVQSDTNHKIIMFSPNGISPDDVHYLEYRPTPETGAARFHYDYMGCDSDSAYGNVNVTAPWDWVKIESIGININNASTGKLYARTNNHLDFSNENCDVYRGTNSSVAAISVGYFWVRDNSPATGSDDAFRYFADVYIDTTPSRVVLANHSDYAQATIIEPQIPSTWQDGSITVTANLGRLQSGTAYLFIFDANNSPNTVGYPVSMNAPAPPSRLRIQ